jgi:hypothetical protein
MSERIADTLRRAADLYLSELECDYGDVDGRKYAFSCDAVLAACGHKNCAELQEARAFMAELGCKTGSFVEFDEFSCGEERQGARYLWLMFAASVADDEE